MMIRPFQKLLLRTFIVSLGSVLAPHIHADNRSARELIELLVHPVQEEGLELGVFTCGSLGTETAKRRAVAAELAALGVAAIPEIETVLDSIERNGPKSPYFHSGAWLLYAYAKIEGPAGYPRLLRLARLPWLRDLQHAIQGSMALALGITSFISTRSVIVDDLCRTPEPRDTTDRFVRAWLANDQAALEECLAPTARAWLQSLTQGRPWATVRAQYWPEPVNDNALVGFRFNLSMRWADPAETLRNPMTIDISGDPIDPAIPTHFVDSTGRVCGKETLKFLTPAKSQAPRTPFLIDNRNLDQIFRTLTSCAKRTATAQ
jgi:hypothetical protein